ncbi:MAG: carboxypeptidase regulatory-like domain-containing protein [Proteobacteria bacterium]|nr:carboxypeptidase regulatory-like domain-containing protein [Pseudomonadota bacterium]
MTGHRLIAIQILLSILFIGCNISGTVTDLDTPIAGVTLTLSGNDIERTVVTGEDGKYTFKSIPDGEYQVTPSMDGYVFYPKMQPVILMGGNIFQINFENFDTAFESISLLSITGAEFVKSGADLKIMAVGTYKDGKDIIVSEFLRWQSEDEGVCTINEYSQLTKLATGVSPGTTTLIAGTDVHHAEMSLEVRDKFYMDTDILIPDIPPPPTFPKGYIAGCCIETCLWAVLHAKGMDMSIEEITATGNMHLDGWGLSSIEIVDVLKKLGVNHKFTYAQKIESFLFICAQTYEDILREKVIARVKEGVPVMFGLKYLPYFYNYLPLPMDHFVLAVGYNEETDEIIYNDINQVNRTTVTKLIDASFGYTALNFYDVIWVVEFPDYKTP